MAIKQYLDLAGIQIFKGLIGNEFTTEDAKNIKTVKISGTTLYFYKTDNPTKDTIADITITLPEQDLSGLLEKISGGVVDNIVTIGADGIVKDSGIKISDVATKTDVNKVNVKVGNVTNLKTATKTNIVSAINELNDDIYDVENKGIISISTNTTTNGYLKSYTIIQNNKTLGVIDIPKDLVVTEGTVVVNPEGQDEGTYIKLVIANQTNPLYINVGTLVDIYHAKKSATQVQLSIDSFTREISATIVASSITTTELADNSITTVKISDANVTLAKLALDVISAFDVSGAASIAETNSKKYADDLNTTMNTKISTLEKTVTNEIQSLATNKVDKVSGKGLSTNDYTTEEKNKLEGIASGAEVNIQADWNVTDNSDDAYIKNKPTIPTVGNGTVTIKQNGTNKGSFTMNQSGNTTIELTDNNTTYSNATVSTSGLMSASDKKKLDGIAAEANNYSLPAASSTTRGGVKIGYSANGKNYPVQLNNEQMYVNVPWTDTNTWRGIQDNLTSTSTSDSLSANQGKVLKGLIDGINKSSIGLGNVNNTEDSVKNVNSTGLIRIPRIKKDLNFSPGGNVGSFEEIEQTSPNLPNQAWYHVFTSQGSDQNYEIQIALRMTSGNDIYMRRKDSGQWSGWTRFLHDSNFTEYALSKNGGTINGDLKVTGIIESNLIKTADTLELAESASTGGINQRILFDFSDKSQDSEYKTNAYMLPGDPPYVKLHLGKQDNPLEDIVSKNYIIPSEEGSIIGATREDGTIAEYLKLTPAFAGADNLYGGLSITVADKNQDIALGDWEAPLFAAYVWYNYSMYLRMYSTGTYRTPTIYFDNINELEIAKLGLINDNTFAIEKSNSDATFNIGSASSPITNLYAENIYGNLKNYAICSTAAATVAKTVSITGFRLVQGATVKVKFSYTNSSTNPTLNVNNTGAKPIYFGSNELNSSDIRVGIIYEFMYDGTNWQLINSNKLVSSTSEGLVPKLPVSNRSNKFLNGHGQWVELPINKVLSAECPISPGTWVTYFKVNFYGTTATNIDSSSVICIRLSVLTTTGKYGDVILKLRAKYNNMYEWVEPYVEPPVWFNYTASITEAVTFEWETGANSSTEVNVFLKAKMNYDDEEAIYRVVNYAIREIDSAITFSYMEQ